MRLIAGLLSCLFLFQLMAKESEKGLFSGRVSRVNRQAGLIRVKVDFANMTPSGGVGKGNDPILIGVLVDVRPCKGKGWMRIHPDEQTG